MILPIQIATGITLSIAGCCLAYQFGVWLDTLRANRRWILKEKRTEERRQYERIVNLLESIAKEIRK